MNRNAVVEISAVDIVPEIKRDLLFFDKLIYDNSQLITIRNYLESFNISNGSEQDEINAIIEFLNSKDVMFPFEITKEDTLEAAKLNSQEVTREMLREFQTWNEYTDNVSAEHRDKIISTNSKFSNGLLKLSDAEVQLSMNTMIEERRNLGDMSCRLISNLYSMIRPNEIFVPVVNNDPHHFTGIPTKKENVLRLVLNNIPTPDSNVSIDEILDFRKGKEEKLQYGRLISWINKLSNGNFNQHEIEEEFNHLLNEYEDGLGKLGSKKNLSNLTAVITMPLEVIEKVVKLNWSKIPETFLKFKHNQLDFKINELRIPGRQIAYIKSAKEKFGKRT